ncbi:MAG TPA: tetratricopeptide repeat-containing serine protease family protein [Candidatus Sulfotelmatobacter sp.]|nr:tetratricopeptide repeat-containing serine protease family protein [Candidatus Sulfotelmatobacter sp.]
MAWDAGIARRWRNRRWAATGLAAALVLAVVPAARAEDPTTPRELVMQPTASLPPHPATGDNAALAQQYARLPNKVGELQALADRGNYLAAFKLGDAYLRGAGIAKDYGRAAVLLRKAADSGLAAAEADVGFLYQNGFGVAQDYAAALDWYRKAAAQRNGIAENNIGNMYQRGLGVPQDYVEATRHFRIAVDLGNAFALANLGANYGTGRGVAPNNLAAYFYLVLAVARMPAASSAAVVRARDTVARQLSPAEIERAQAAARDWKPGAPVTLIAIATAPGGVRAGSNAAAPVKGIGTGFAVSPAGHLLTNNHVVQSCSSVRVHRQGDAAVPADVVAHDQQNDLALLKVAIALHDVVAFRDGRGLRQGDDVLAYGFPLAGTLAREGNLSIGSVSALAGVNNDTRYLQISAPVQPGNSGGPLMDDAGNLVGVVSSKLNALAVAAVVGDLPQNVNFAIKEAVARDFLDANGVAYRTAASTHPLKAADLAERARRFTFLVECR